MTRPRSCWPLSFTLGVGALGVVACQRPAPATQAPTTAPSTEAEAPSTTDDEDTTPAAAPTHPLELVPARARVMLMARSPERFLQILERERLSGQYPKIYAEIVSDMKRAIGHDLLDPSQLAAVGIDPTGPLGFALLDLRDEAFVLFGSSPDPQPLVDLLDKVIEEPLKERTVGDARMLRLDREVTLVLRDGMFAFVLVDHQRDGQPDYAQEVARIDPAQSVAHSPVMSRAHQGLPAEADVQGLLDVAGIMHDEMGRMRRFEQESLADAHRQLAEARARGATTEEINNLQQRIISEQTFVARARRERQIVQLLLSRTIGSIEGIGLAVDASERGLGGRIHVALTADSMFRDLVRSADPPAAIRALSEEPLFVASGRVDVSVAIDLLSQLLMAEGSSYAELNDELRDELHIDFDRAVRPLLTGDATLAFTSPERLEPTTAPDLDDALGGLLAIGVRDEASTEALLREQIAAMPKAIRTEVPELNGWSVQVDDISAPLWIGVVASQVVVTTDRAAIEHLRDQTAGSASQHYAHPDPWQWLTEGPAVGRLGMHHRLPLIFLFSIVRGFTSFDVPRDVDFTLSSEFPDDDIHSIPRSTKTQRLVQQYERAQDAYRELEDRQSKERTIKAWNLTRALGITAGAIRHDKSGLLIEGGHYVDGGLGRYVETLVELSMLDDQSTSVDAKLARALAKRDAAEQRLLTARRKEIKRALKR